MICLPLSFTLNHKTLPLLCVQLYNMIFFRNNPFCIFVSNGWGFGCKPVQKISTSIHRLKTVSWRLLCLCRITFLVAEACLLAGATKNAYHTKYRHMIYAQNFSCESLRKGVFIAGAVFVVFNMVLNVYYYIYFSKATSSLTEAHKANRSSSTVGMTGYK